LARRKGMNKTLYQKKCIPCQGGIPPLNKDEIDILVKELNINWEIYKGKELRKEYVFTTYKEAITFVNNVAELAEDEGHHPFIHINYKKVLIILFTHKISGLHENDFILASKCDLLHRRL
jgi:4a-hydroxytetrahydrobiopterin dehydratase